MEVYESSVEFSNKLRDLDKENFQIISNLEKAISSSTVVDREELKEIIKLLMKICYKQIEFDEQLRTKMFNLETEISGLKFQNKCLEEEVADWKLKKQIMKN